MVEFLIGTSGWSYEHWVNVFYPQDLKPNEWLSFYSKHFNTVEINMTFYRIPFDNMIKGWINKTPENFIFSIKAPRFITHKKRLNDIEEPMQKLYTMAEKFRNKVQCILFQFPPSFHNTPENIQKIEKLLKLINPDYKHAFEFRHSSWWQNEFCLLINKKAGFCTVNGLNMPEDLMVTADFLYVRFHGERYNTMYSDEFLSKFALQIKKTVQEYGIKKVFVYFNNDFSGFAVKNALFLKKLLNG